MLRFRPNLIIDLDDHTPFQEEVWIGKEVRIGDAVLSIKKGCQRCAYVNIDPSTQQIDHSVLKTVVKENKMIFGVYPTVVKNGQIQKNDIVRLQ